MQAALNLPRLAELEDQSAERALLATLIKEVPFNPDLLKYVRSEELFTDETYKVLFNAISSLTSEGIRVSAFVLSRKCNEISKNPQWTAIIKEIQGDTSPIDAHAVSMQLSELAARRVYVQTLWDLSQKFTSRDHDVFKLAEITRNSLEEFMMNLTNLTERNNEMIYQEWWAERMEILEGKRQPGLMTGILDLDKVFRGIAPTESVVIAARPAMGKTALACQIIYNISVAQGIYGAFMSLEMEDKQVFQRLVCIESGYSNMEYKTMVNMNTQYAKRCAERIKNAPFYIGDGQMTIGQIEARARELKRKHDLQYLFVDYIGLVDTDDNKMNREQQVASISKRLKNLANKLKIVVFPLSQLNRAVEKQSDKRPNLADLRESGAIEQDADKVIMLYRPAYYGDTEEGDKLLLELWVRKNRSGATTSDLPVETNYELETNRIWHRHEHSPFHMPPGHGLEATTVDKPSINSFNHSTEVNF